MSRITRSLKVCDSSAVLTELTGQAWDSLSRFFICLGCLPLTRGIMIWEFGLEDCKVLEGSFLPFVYLLYVLHSFCLSWLSTRLISETGILDVPNMNVALAFSGYLNIFWCHGVLKIKIIGYSFLINFYLIIIKWNEYYEGRWFWWALGVVRIFIKSQRDEKRKNLLFKLAMWDRYIS